MNAYVDRLTGWLAELIARHMPGNAGFNSVAYALAGIHEHGPLPADYRMEQRRRDQPEEGPILRAAEARGYGKQRPEKKPGNGGGTPAVAVNCSETKYCGIGGRPCSCCGGSDTSCPSGTTRGSYWSYCCGGTNYFYYDCCGGTVSCPSNCPFCNNNPQPNWCGGAGGNRYVCTQVAPQGRC